MTGGTPVGAFTDADVHTYRCRARELLEYACGYPEVRAVDTTHPRYREVIEHRQYTPPSSSCGDLAHWMMFALGVRLGWINRDAHRGWRVGLNVNLLVPPPIGACTNARAYLAGERLECGDVIVIANKWPSGTDAHVVCVIDQPEPDVLLTAEYGQPGGALCEHVIMAGRLCTRRANGQLTVGRTIRTTLPLARVLASAYTTGLLA